MEIKYELAKTLKEKPADESKLGFGHIFTDHMFIMNYDIGEGWHDARIVPYGDISLRLCACITVRKSLKDLKLTVLPKVKFSFSVLMKILRE